MTERSHVSLGSNTFSDDGSSKSGQGKDHGVYLAEAFMRTEHQECMKLTLQY